MPAAFEYPPVKYRKKGLPKRLKRISGIRGLSVAFDLFFDKPDGPLAKVAVFRDRESMRHFYHEILPQYNDGGAGDKLCRRTAAVVCGLFTDVESFDKRTEDWVRTRYVDKRYFCLVLLCEGDISAEILAHEAVHVGFAWDRRTRGESVFTDKDNYEENICYPAGLFVDHALAAIKELGLREI